MGFNAAPVEKQQALALELYHRFTDRRAADAELPRERCFGEMISRA